MQEARQPNRPSIGEHLLVGLASLILLEQHSRLPEAAFFVFLLCGGLIAGVGLAYFVRIVTQRVGGEPDGRRFAKLRTAVSWIVFPVAVALVLSSAATHWPATIRFYLSKSAFEDVLAEVEQGNKPAGFPRRVGLYWVDRIQYDFDYQTEQPITGFVTGVALVDECGIYYNPKNPPSSHWLTTRIAPCWYLTEW